MHYGGGKRLRQGRHSEEGYVYHVVFSTLNRTPILNSFNNARAVVRQLINSDSAGYTDTFAYCVMPDHVHWLFALRQGDLSKNVQRVKANVSRAVAEKLWHKGFYDHAIRTDESLISVARYIVANPLRAGLVETIGDYPHWDSIWLE